MSARMELQESGKQDEERLKYEKPSNPCLS
jgi:hypothetical protein